MYLGALLSEDGEKVFNVIFFSDGPLLKQQLLNHLLEPLKINQKKEKRKSIQKS